MSEPDVDLFEEEDQQNIGAGFEISLREITELEQNVLSEKVIAPYDCQNANVHIWKLEKVEPNCCHLFSSINVIAVALGGEHILVLTDEGKIFGHGSNLYGQLGIGNTDETAGTHLVNALNGINITKIACGARHSAATTSAGELYCWGDSKQGQCGIKEKGVISLPAKLKFQPIRKTNNINVIEQRETLVKEISCGELFTAVLDRKGFVWTWGTGFGLGHGVQYDECATPKLLSKLSHKRVAQLVCGAFHCLVIVEDEFEDCKLNSPNPDLRTSSVSSAYYTALKLTPTENPSKVPFLKSTVYRSVNEEDIAETMKRSLSDTELNIYGLADKSEKFESQFSGCCNSETNLSRDHTDQQGVTNQSSNLNGLPRYHCETASSESLKSSPGNLAGLSSQYHSAVEIHSKLNRQMEKCLNIETNINQMISNSDEMRSADSDSKSSPFQNIETPEESKRNIFDGRKSLFEEICTKSLQTVGLSSDSLTEPLDLKNKATYRPHLLSEREKSANTCPSTEVWSWGRCNYGQLGHEDSNDRYEPLCIKKLANKNIIKITAGAYHSLAVSADGQVYSWGDNTFGQLGLNKALIPEPKKIKVLTIKRIWDVAAGRNFSLFLGDSDRNKSNVYFCGEVDGPKDIRASSNPIISVRSESVKKNEGRWRLSKRSKRTSEGYISSSFVEIQVKKLKHFKEDELVRCLNANGYSFSCITKLDSKGTDFETIYKFATTERLFYQQLKIILEVIIEPLMQTDAWSHLSKSIGGECIIPLIDSFVDLLNGIKIELSHLTNFIRCSLSNNELFTYLFSDSFRGLYDRYSTCYSDALAVGLLQMCNKPAGQIMSKIKIIIEDLERHLSISPATFESLLKVPMMRSYVYCDLAKKMVSHFTSKTESDQMKEVISRWTSFSDASTKQLISAGITNKFWNEYPTKIVEALKDPQRRLLKSSKVDPLNLARASRLSSHSYILFNDVFVHAQFNRNFQVFPLVTLWADSLEDSDELNNAMKMTSPEESFILSAGTPDGKISWLTEINKGIAQCLKSSSSLNLDIDAVNSSSGLLKAAVARVAEYIYVNHLTYKSATYKGMWLSGLPHGRGRMSWPDGCTYEGEFVNGYFHGHGQITWPGTNTIFDKVYDGEWTQGSITGRGTMRYHNGEEYIGNFKDGLRHGHGTLKSSQSKTALETVYVGNWENDIKTGYGVLDYILRGEKYMGMWQNDQRNGHGVVVTVDGVYYEGKFIQNKLVGKGILLSEDDTSYEGEFTADMLLSGKGILTQPNGDFIDGTFYGKWGEGIKVNGVFCKFSNQRNQSFNGNSQINLPGTNDCAIDAELKWRSLFAECYNTLGCKDTFLTQTDEAWRNVTNALLKSSCIVSNNTCIALHLSNKKTNYREKMDLAHNLKGLQDYLSEAFDTKGHPLNLLIDGLVEVYRATYVGVGAHRRLLSHAVEEAKSYVTRIFNVLRVLFPDLHDEEFVLLSNDTADGVMETPINSMSLLHPLLLPRLYPPLFTLYALQTEKTDAVYTEKLYYLNKRGDIALMSFLGIKNTFWLLSKEADENVEKSKHVKKAYLPAIETLERISTSYSPMEKIEIVRRTFAKIHEEINDHFQDDGHILAMDDLFPLFQYIVIRASVPHLGSEIKFIEDMVDDSILVGESGHMVTTLSACYFQIQNERDRD